MFSASQQARSRADGAVRQRNAPLPMVCNCDRSIVANGPYPHTPDHHGAGPSTSARLPCANLRRSSPPRVVFCVAARRDPGRSSGKRLALFFFANGKSQRFDLGQEPLNLRLSSCRSGSMRADFCPHWPPYAWRITVGSELISLEIENGTTAQSNGSIRPRAIDQRAAGLSA
jgi:hypothetical protein